MTATEILRIKNFAGIEEAEIELSRMNVFIGPQASGKSVCAKLFFYFKEIIRELPVDVTDELTKSQMRVAHRADFLKYFPTDNWGPEIFEIEFSLGPLWIKVSQKPTSASKISIEYSAFFDSLLAVSRHKWNSLLKSKDFNPDPDRHPILVVGDAMVELLLMNNALALANPNTFIPAGRSFFSAIQSNVFDLISNNLTIDPFLAEFGSVYSHMRRIYERFNVAHERDDQINRYCSRLLCGKHERVRGRDYIQASDGRRVSLQNSSSGQQEVLPLTIILSGMAKSDEGLDRTTLFVEEPEAHLYPTAQREIVHLLAAVTDLSSDETTSQYVITTHSPYILSALNNLMYGAQIAQEGPEKRSRVTRILGDAALVDPANVRAYAFGDGRVESIIDQKTGLVRATMLDSVSNELAKEFGALLDVAFEEMAA